MSSISDSNSDCSPHFQLIETLALVEPDRSGDRKCNARTNKSITLNKNNRILLDLDKIEVLPDNNNESNSITRDSQGFSYQAFKNQLNVTQESSAQILNPLTSTKVHNSPLNKKIIVPKTVTKSFAAPRIQYNMEKYQFIQSIYEEDKLCDIIKRGTTPLPKNGSKPVDNNNDSNSITKDSQGFSYGAFKNQLIADARTLNKTRENSVQKFNPLTSTGVHNAPLNKKRIVPKTVAKSSAAPRIQYNMEKYQFIESISEEDKLFDIIKRGTTPLPKNGSKPVERYPRAHPYPYIKKFNCKDSSEDDILEAAQKEQKTMKKGRSTASKKKICKKSKAGKNNSNVHLPQSFHKNVKPKESPVDILEYLKSIKTFSSLPSLRIDSVSKPSDGPKTSTSKIYTPLEPVLEDDKIIVRKPEESPVGISKCVQNFKQDEFSSLSSLCNSLELNSDLEPIEENGIKILSNCRLKPNEEMHPSVKDLLVSNKNTEVIRNQTMVLSQSNFLGRFDKFQMSECADSGLLMKNKFRKSNMEIYEWIATGAETQEDAIFNQTEERLREMSKLIQNSLNAVHGPITFKNCKIYNFLVELENKLNAYLSANSDIEDIDFDNYM